MIRRSTAMNVRQNLGELLNKVEYRHDSVVITKAGKPVAALVDIQLFERIRQMREQFDALSLELAAAAKDTDIDTLEIDIDQAVKAVRKDKK